jgi:hypothetical protein
MRVTIWLTPEQLSTLQDQARLAHRPPKDHLEWLIEQTLQGENDLRDRVERLEQRVGLCPLS